MARSAASIEPLLPPGIGTTKLTSAQPTARKETKTSLHPREFVSSLSLLAMTKADGRCQARSGSAYLKCDSG